MLIIDDDNAHLFENEVPEGMARGHVPRDWDKIPFGSLAGAVPFDGPIIPRYDWDALIEEREAKGQTLKALDVPRKNQQQTNFCWANGPLHCVEIMRVKNGFKYVELSSASVACRINGFQNRGGYGGEALKHIANEGANTVDQWPNAVISRRYDTSDSRQAAARNRISEWWDMPNSKDRFDIMMTALFLGVPCAIGLNWWGHLVTAIDPIRIEGGHYGALIDNSWGSTWQDKGRIVLAESKATPDDCVCPRVPYGA